MTYEIMLTKGYTAIVDDADKDLAELKWSLNFRNGKGYAVKLTRNDDGKTQATYMHRLILSRIIGCELTDKQFCDHIDGNPCNNVRSNLRIANHAENMRNRKKGKDNTSGFKGVSLRSPGRWAACIKHNNKTVHLGSYDSPEAAHDAYCKAAKKYHGEFARFE